MLKMSLRKNDRELGDCQLYRAIRELISLISSKNDTIRMRAIIVAGATGCKNLVSLLKYRALCSGLYGDSLARSLELYWIQLSLALLGEKVHNFRKTLNFYSNDPTSVMTLFPFAHGYLTKDISGENLPLNFYFALALKRAEMDYSNSPLHPVFLLFQFKPWLQEMRETELENEWLSMVMERMSLSHNSPAKELAAITGSALLKAKRMDKSEIFPALSSVIKAIPEDKDLPIEVLSDLCLLFPKLWSTKL